MYEEYKRVGIDASMHLHGEVINIDTQQCENYNIITIYTTAGVVHINDYGKGSAEYKPAEKAPAPIPGQLTMDCSSDPVAPAEHDYHADTQEPQQ